MADIKVQGPVVQQQGKVKQGPEGKKSLYSEGLNQVGISVSNATKKTVSTTTSSLLPDEPTMEPAAMASFARTGAKTVSRFNEDPETNEQRKELDLSLQAIQGFMRTAIEEAGAHQQMLHDNMASIGAEADPNSASKRESANREVMKLEQRQRDLEKANSPEREAKCLAVSSQMTAAFDANPALAGKPVTGMTVGQGEDAEVLKKMIALSAMVGGFVKNDDAGINVSRMTLVMERLRSNIEAGTEAKKNLGSASGLASAASFMKSGAPKPNTGGMSKPTGDIKAE